jgi:hypothetical protein
MEHDLIAELTWREFLNMLSDVHETEVLITNEYGLDGRGKLDRGCV